MRWDRNERERERDLVDCRCGISCENEMQSPGKGEAETGLRLWEGDELEPLDGRSWTTDGQNLGIVLSEEIHFHPDVSF